MHILNMIRSLSTAFFAAALFCGCLSSPPKAAVNWTLDFHSDAVGRDASAQGDFLTSGPVRLSQITVRSPDSGTRLLVLRPDGSVAFDNYNQFAAAPGLLVRNVAEDALVSSGRFPGVVGSSSGISTPYAMEVNITRLALDCRQEGRRDALVALNVMLIDNHKIVSTGFGEATVPAGDGNYSAAFSKALAQSLADAIRMLRKE